MRFERKKLADQIGVLKQQIAVADGQIAEREIQLSLLGVNSVDVPNVPVYPSRELAEEAIEKRGTTADGQTHEDVLGNRRGTRYRREAKDFLELIDETDEE